MRRVGVAAAAALEHGGEEGLAGGEGERVGEEVVAFYAEVVGACGVEGGGGGGRGGWEGWGRGRGDVCGGGEEEGEGRGMEEEEDGEEGGWWVHLIAF